MREFHNSPASSLNLESFGASEEKQEEQKEHVQLSASQIEMAISPNMDLIQQTSVLGKFYAKQIVAEEDERQMHEMLNVQAVCFEKTSQIMAFWDQTERGKTRD